MDTDFDLQDFLPYVLNLAAEEASLSFQRHYKERYGMLRTEWRVLFHLGRYGEMTAKEICTRARIHKTKVSRAVAALEERRFVKRKELLEDRRHALIKTTAQGRKVFQDLFEKARTFDDTLAAQFSKEEEAVLRRCLRKLAKLD